MKKTKKKRNLILNNWKPKIATLLIAIAIWYLVKGHVERLQRQNNPVPGTGGISVGIFRAPDPGPMLARHLYPGIILVVPADEPPGPAFIFLS